MRKLYFDPEHPALDLEMIICAAVYLAAATFVLYKNQTGVKDRFVSTLMAIMIFEAFCDFFVTFAYAYKYDYEETDGNYIPLNNLYLLECAYTLYDIGDLEHWVFAIKYLDSAAWIQFNTYLTRKNIHVFGWTIAVLYTLAILVLKVWAMISYPRHGTEADLE
jgi:hypothetical protein